MKIRNCRWCGKEFPVATRADANRRYCSKSCTKTSQQKRHRVWTDEHPDAMAQYNQTRLAKNPGAWREEARSARLRTLELLGGACIVCGVTNPSWLHVDYIPTSIGKRYRHARGFAYVRDHVEDFRLLCANHHYELTLTGRIEGTEIVQARWTRNGVIDPS